jgi:hypothetical protein
MSSPVTLALIREGIEILSRSEDYDPFFVDTPDIPPSPDDPYMGPCDCCGEDCERRPGVRFCNLACKDKGAPQGVKKCAQCGEIFTPLQARGILCGNECRIARMAGRSKTRGKRWKPASHCEFCDKVYRPTKNGQKYCNTKCRNDDHAKTARESIPRSKCRQCKEMFQPERKGVVLCSDACKKQNKRAAERDRYHTKLALDKMGDKA